MRSTVLASTLALAAAWLCGCSYSKTDHPQACRRDADCGKNEHCYQEYCLPKPKTDAGSHSVDSGADSGTGMMRDSGMSTGDAGAPCLSGQPPEDCYDGPAGTSGVGVCKAGQRACIGGTYTQCLGQVLPGDETCNGKDDNCDGTIDEIAMGDCDTVMPGACTAGHLMCRGAFAVCEVSNPPVDETCNGIDDDCDGKTDEVASSACYPASTAGCTIGSDGSATCVGLCHAGMSDCMNGKGGCGGAVTPAPEVCTSGSGLAADEDCDGMIDEGCNCSNGATRPCYAGQMGTESNPPCHAGTQSCANHAWGDCIGEVLPNPPETCQNQGVDDDCNGFVDDVPMLGDPCIDDSKLGNCRSGTYQCADPSSPTPVCVTMQPMPELCDAIDQDCDGNPYNGFDLNTDPQNCGKCGNACAASDTCCDGMCISTSSFQSDPQNCGKCGNLCGRGQYCCQGDCLTSSGGGTGGKGGLTLEPICACTTDCGAQSCCGTTCVDLATDAKNCGACGHACSTGEVCCGTRGCVTSTTCLIKL